MISQRSALRIFAALPASICGNPHRLKSSTIESRRNANMRWPPKQPHLDGRLSKLSLSTKILAFPDPVSWRAMALPDLLPKSLSAMSALYSASKSRGSRATMPTGIASWISAESPTPSSAMPMASINPAMFNDRLLLGLKGTMSEAELHVLRARLLGGIRNKAARGELRRNLPVGFVWGEQDGEVCLHPDESVRAAIQTVLTRFAELGSVRRVWLWFRSEGLCLPLRMHYGAKIRWVDPSYIAVYHILTSPVYAGAYAYGKSRHEITLDAYGVRKKRARKLPRSQWQVFIPNHHEGFIDWNTYEANRARITANTHPRPHQSGSGAVREGTALLQGIAVCGRCGRKLRTHYTGRTASAGYHCAGKDITNGRGVYCLTIGALQVDEAVERAVLAALAPIGVEAAIAAAERLEADRDGALAQWRLTVERASYETQRAERRYRAVDPDNRLVARGLEAEWEKALRELDRAKAELAHREALRPKTLSANERCRLLALGTDLSTVWRAP